MHPPQAHGVGKAHCCMRMHAVRASAPIAQVIDGRWSLGPYEKLRRSQQPAAVHTLKNAQWAANSASYAERPVMHSHARLCTAPGDAVCSGSAAGNASPFGQQPVAKP
eukprot:361177-Chlamydomonas_euryale.AAC.6